MPHCGLRKSCGGSGWSQQGWRSHPGGVRGQLVAGKYLAELEFLLEDPEFWAELGQDPGRNIGQRPCAGQGGELSCVPSGCHVLGCVPCPSRRGFCAPRRVLAPKQVGPSPRMLPDLAVGGKFPGAWGNLDQEEKHGITRPVRNRRRANKGVERSVQQVLRQEMLILGMCWAGQSCKPLDFY